MASQRTNAQASIHEQDEQHMTNIPIKAEKQSVRFFDGLEVDGYRMPDGEFRVGLASASRALGFDREWLSV